MRVPVIMKVLAQAIQIACFKTCRPTLQWRVGMKSWNFPVKLTWY